MAVQCYNWDDSELALDDSELRGGAVGWRPPAAAAAGRRGAGVLLMKPLSSIRASPFINTCSPPLPYTHAYAALSTACN